MVIHGKKVYHIGALFFVLIIAQFILINPTSATSHTLTLSSSGAQNINITAATNTVVSTDSISVATTCRYGYNLVSSTSVNDNNLYLNGDASNNTSGTFFSPSDGTTILSNATNTWGYYYNANSAVAPTANSVFSPVPALGNTATIKTPLTTPASTDISDSFDIYYGVNSAPTMAKGTYKMIPDTNNSNNNGTIVYQATMADACIKYTVHFSPTSTATGSTVSGTGTMNDQLIAEGIATQLNSNTFTAPNGYYFAGWNTAQDGSGTQYTNQQQVTDLTTAGNTITLYAMWTDCPGGRICYSPNVTNASDVTGTMGDQTVSNSATSATLYAPNFKRDNYGFAGWNTKADGTGTNYGPNQTITITAGQYQNGGLRLYANWIASAGSLQNWTCPNDTDMPIGTVTALKDTRDNNVYAVAKLADGKCWTIENLRLADKDSSNNDIDLDSTNTHNPALPLTNIYDSSTTSNHLSPTSALAYDATTAPEGWCHDYYSSACIDQSRLRTDNTTLFTNNTASGYSTGDNVYSYGNYYNWYSATAGHGTYNKSSGNTAGDICPAGWHLPTGRYATGEFGLLDIALGGTGASSSSSTTPTGSIMSLAYRSYPNNFVYSGYVYDASVGGRNASGGYWSTSAAGTQRPSAYYMGFTSGGVYPGTNLYYKCDGWPVRCVAGS